MPKHNLGQRIFFLRNNKVHSAKITGRLFVDNDATSMLDKAFGVDRIQYSTCHGVVDENEAFATKEELLASL